MSLCHITIVSIDCAKIRNIFGFKWRAFNILGWCGYILPSGFLPVIWRGQYARYRTAVKTLISCGVDTYKYLE